MAKIQFNCRLEQATVDKINAEVEMLTKTHGFVLSQGDVIELRFAGPVVQSGKKLSKREQKIAAIRAQDPMADQRPELPSGGSVLDATGVSIKAQTGKVSLPTWRAGRKPLPKPKDRGK